MVRQTWLAVVLMIAAIGCGDVRRDGLAGTVDASGAGDAPGSAGAGEGGSAGGGAGGGDGAAGATASQGGTVGTAGTGETGGTVGAAGAGGVGGAACLSADSPGFAFRGDVARCGEDAGPARCYPRCELAGDRFVGCVRTASATVACVATCTECP